MGVPVSNNVQPYIPDTPEGFRTDNRGGVGGAIHIRELVINALRMRSKQTEAGSAIRPTAYQMLR